MDPEDELAEELAAEETSGEDPWHEEGWYFDLPAGAWERQEAKNRLLRDNIRANVKRDTSLRALEARRDPFHARDALLGLAQHADRPAWGEEMDDAPVSQQTGDAWLESEEFDEEEPGSWKAELPDRKPRTTWQEEEPEPEWGAPEDLERRTGPRRRVRQRSNTSQRQTKTRHGSRRHSGAGPAATEVLKRRRCLGAGCRGQRGVAEAFPLGRDVWGTARYVHRRRDARLEQRCKAQ